MNNKVTRFRNQMERLYKQLKLPNISTYEYVKLLVELEKVSFQYIGALVMDDTIDHLQFFDLIDILNDNISFLKEKIRK
jgi:hypothetical protein